MFAAPNAIRVPMYPARPNRSVNPTQSNVLTMRNGMRRLARSVIAPSSGETTKIVPIDTAVAHPTTLSARSFPTWSRAHSAKNAESTPIEKIVFARSYSTHDATALTGAGLSSPMRIDADAKSAAGSAPRVPISGTGTSRFVIVGHHTVTHYDGQAGATDIRSYIARS